MMYWYWVWMVRLFFVFLNNLLNTLSFPPKKHLIFVMWRWLVSAFTDVSKLRRICRSAKRPYAWAFSSGFLRINGSIQQSYWGSDENFVKTIQNHTVIKHYSHSKTWDFALWQTLSCKQTLPWAYHDESWVLPGSWRWRWLCGLAVVPGWPETVRSGP